jgi:hypothetical protein
MKRLLRSLFAVLAGSAIFMTAGAALAAGEPCYNDIDCPEGPTCGGEVCNWGKTHPTPDGMKVYTCVPAGTGNKEGNAKKGQDGWCTVTTDCKCAAEGATCRAPYCTFTKASDAPAGTGGTGTAGTASMGTAGTATGGSGTAGGATMPKEEDSGGCSLSGNPAREGAALALLLGAGAAGTAFARRRSRKSA